LFTRWRAVFVTVALVLCGLSFYFYTAVVSMTNPPGNWGYARTLEGFIHMLSRGQFERLQPAISWLNPDAISPVSAILDRNVSCHGLDLSASARHSFSFPAQNERTRTRLAAGPDRFICCPVILHARHVEPPPSDSGAWSLMSLYFPASHLS